jgi:hypothetical protein
MATGERWKTKLWHCIFRHDTTFSCKRRKNSSLKEKTVFFFFSKGWTLWELLTRSGWENSLFYRFKNFFFPFGSFSFYYRFFFIIIIIPFPFVCVCVLWTFYSTEMKGPPVVSTRRAGQRPQEIFVAEYFCLFLHFTVPTVAPVCFFSVCIIKMNEKKIKK